MTTSLNTFDFNSNTICVVDIDGEPWFMARDAYTCLGLSQHGGILNPLADNEKIKRARTSLGLSAGREVWLISESGLYKLIMRSDKPVAREFQNWVTQVVLPAIRKDGMYVAGEEKVATGETSEAEFFARAVLAANKKLERLTAERDAYNVEFEEVTIATYTATNKVYLSHGEKVFLAQMATMLARTRGITLKSEPRTLARNGKTIHTKINVYPRAILDEAAVALGIIKRARPVMALN